ncbi:DUF3139 domain-containing protein [Rossellomorea aquimaris]|uniref:DUF3139 domain-containing protein n=1 Tax=Rossellomorea aquimaris TaxID=189382 RepID=UPI0007D084C9|nr:DUF3139 domain-containing protein [Rossellomorea aquimaris]
MPKNIKNRKVILAIPLVVILLSYFSYIVYVDVGEERRYDEILTHLTIDKEYEENEIKEIQIDHSITNVLLSYRPWVMYVVFKDEPNAIYYYHYDNGVISQGGISGYTENEIYTHSEGTNGPLDKSK